MSQTLLGVIRTFAGRTGVAQPTFVIGNTDYQVTQLHALLSEVLDDLMMYDWEALTQEATFATVAAAEQGVLTTLAPNGFKWILNDTIFNRTEKTAVIGPETARTWQARKAIGGATVTGHYRIVRGKLFFDPIPTAGQTCAFEYASNYAVLAADGLTYKQYPTVDTDTFLLPDTLLLAGLRWKWKYEKGLEYAEDFRQYETMSLNLRGRDGTKTAIALDASPPSASPCLYVPDGNWSLP